MPIQKVLKSNLNSIITFTQNLNKSFTTLWNFFGDASSSNQCMTTFVKSSQFFFHSLHLWYHDIMRNFIIFRLRLSFIEFKIYSVTHSWACFVNQMIDFLSLNSSTMCQIGLNNKNIIFPFIIPHFTVLIWIIPNISI